jgi:hypothetical protein
VCVNWKPQQWGGLSRSWAVAPQKNKISTDLLKKFCHRGILVRFPSGARRAVGPILLGSRCDPELSTDTSYSLMLSFHLRSVFLPPTSNFCAVIVPLACYRSVACLNVITLSTCVQTCLQILEVCSICIDYIVIQLYVHSLLHFLRCIKLVLCPQRPFFMHVLTS